MTETVEKPAASGEAAAGTGRVARVIGPVVDVEFPAEHMPEIYFALHVDVVLGADDADADAGSRAAHRRQHRARDLHAAHRRADPRR